MSLTDEQKSALERLLIGFALEQRETKMSGLFEEIRGLGCARGYSLLRQISLVWQRADDYSRQNGGSDTPGFEVALRLAAHLLGWEASGIESVRLEPISELGEGWRLSCGGRSQGRGGSERKVFPEEILDAMEALHVTMGRGEELAPMPGPLSIVLSDESWRVVVFARAADGRLHRLSLALDRRLVAEDAKREAFERAIRTGVLTEVTGGLGDYDLHDQSGEFVSAETPLWRSGGSYPIVFELRRRRRRDGEGPIDVEVHFDGRLFAAGYYPEDTIGEVASQALESLGDDPKASVSLHTLGAAVVWEQSLRPEMTVGAYAGGRRRAVLVLERGTVDELAVTIRLGAVDREVTSHATESDSISGIICAVLVKVRPEVMSSTAWELFVGPEPGIPMEHDAPWESVRRAYFSSDSSSNVLEGAGRGLVARSPRPFKLAMRLREPRLEG